ncbi:MAG: hypothetical protein CFH10_00304 [Alphaproteobacteria bacterium MarineAlpha4_Bin2]|nr:MAG: hypothetical protein CFH10_00304 [Alphaproteobacteria bacterium MarineAlpha4_Bin2]
MLTLLHWFVLIVVLLRAAELIYANRNAKRLLAQGGIEYGRTHYPLFILLHVSWLSAILLLTPVNFPTTLWLLGIFLLLQACRLWVILSLGPYWTTRVISSPNFPLVAHGPYRWVKHPNYIIVCTEIAVLPLAFGAWQVALFFSLLNAALITWRIKIETHALAKRLGRE